ncbi:MAG TPA: nuclear transport factor 2 family protein [Puia sp.]|jgi:ketosteroid isomerase-like protein|nr:nuclear transport factor 2 family protein [Puia sp.]
MTKIISSLAFILTGLATFGQTNSLNKNAMNKKIVYDFVDAINEHNVEKIYSLMTDDHKFIDAHGNEVSGKDKMKAGWTGYFQWFPDYKIEITDIFFNGDTLAAFGFASGTFKGIKTEKDENYWRLPASWKIIVENNKIKLWQVYADTKIPFDIIGKNK